MSLTIGKAIGMEIISKADAKNQGLKRFFSGVPCKAKQHVSERYTINGVCVACQKELRSSPRCKAYDIRYRAKDSELQRDLYAIHKAGIRVGKHVRPAWADLTSIKRIYRAAREMTLKYGVFYTVDHIVPLKSKVVCGLHCEANLQILTKSDNSKKFNYCWPDMP